MATIHWQIAETDSDKQVCYQIRGEYLRKYSPEYASISLAELGQIAEIDDYDSGTLSDGKPRTTTYLITVDGEPAGTVRFGLIWTTRSGSLGSYLEDMFEVHGGFQRLESLTGKAEVTVAEVSRLAILRHYRKDYALPILKAMMACSHDVGVDVGVCMTPPAVAAGFHLIGAPLQPLTDLRPRLDDRKAVRSLARGHRYYFPGLRAKHPDLDDPAAVEGLSDAALLSMIRNEPVVPRLYWSDRDRNAFTANDFEC